MSIIEEYGAFKHIIKCLPFHEHFTIMKFIVFKSSEFMLPVCMFARANMYYILTGCIMVLFKFYHKY